MSYDAVRQRLDRWKNKNRTNDEADNAPEFLEALEELASALESDLRQIKARLSHMSQLLEKDRDV